MSFIKKILNLTTVLDDVKQCAKDVVAVIDTAEKVAKDTINEVKQTIKEREKKDD